MVKSIIGNGTNFFFKSQKTIISAASVISVTYAISAFLSFLRTRILSSYFGDSSELGVFFTADRIPTLIFSILVVGTLSSVFIPIFTSYVKKDEQEAWCISSSIINISLLTFLVFGITAFIFAKQIMIVLSVGRFNQAELTLGASLMRIMVLAQIILIVSSFISSILQSFRYFLVPSLAPVLYNLGMILGIVFLTPVIGIYSAAFGVIVGSIMHLLIQLPVLRRVNFKHSFVLNFGDKGVREIFSLLPPRLFASAINQVSATIDTSLAILISASSVVVFKFADQLQTFPVNLFGVSIALAALPTLSYESSDDNYSKFKKTFMTSLHQMLFLVIPAAVVLLVLRVPVVRLVYGASRFSWEATLATSYTVAFFSISVFSQSAAYLVTRAFYALADTKTPLKVLFFTMPFDILFSLFLIKVLGFGVWSIALSYSVSSIIDFVVTLYLLGKKVGGFDPQALFEPFIKISYSAVFMGISLYLPMKLMERFIFDTTRTLPLFMLTVTACIFGFLSYLFFTKVFSVKEVELLYRVLGKFKLRPGISAATDAATTIEFEEIVGS